MSPYYPGAVRRLFFTFAGGPPGVGLLLVRLLAGIAVVAHGVDVLHAAPALGIAISTSLLIGVGLLLIAGLWTPVAAGLIAAAAFWDTFAHPEDHWYALIVGVLGLALVLLGPGAWSVDARIFGWKRL